MSFLGVLPVWIVGAEDTPTPTESEIKAAADLAPGAKKSPEDQTIPFIVRIDKSTIQRFVTTEHNEHRPIDQMVLGARVRGKSHTVGKSHSELVENPTEATFDIIFKGKTTTTTTSVKEPGVVYGRTFTEFTCKRRVRFDPKEGFVVRNKTECDGTTKLVFDGFGSTKQLGRRIISLVAERQSNQSHETARQIADHDNKRDVRVGFEKEVDKSLDAANKDMNLQHYVDQVFGKDSKLELFTKSDAESIHIGLGPSGEKYAPMTALPPRGPDAPGMEIWVHSSILSEPVAAALKMITPDSKQPLVEKSKIFGGLKILPSSVSSTANLALQDGWLVIGLPEGEPAATAEAPADTERK